MFMKLMFSVLFEGLNFGKLHFVSNIFVSFMHIITFYLLLFVKLVLLFIYRLPFILLVKISIKGGMHLKL